MLIEIPDHYMTNVAVAMVRVAAEHMWETEMVPAFLFQYADLWSRGINFGSSDTFWQAVVGYRPGLREFMEKRNLL